MHTPSDTDPYWRKIKERVFPLSSEQTDIKKALTEWVADCLPIRVDDDTCQLCGKPHIAWHHQVKNQLTGQELLVGTDCVERFSTYILGLDGRVHSGTRAEDHLKSGVRAAHKEWEQGKQAVTQAERRQAIQKSQEEAAAQHRLREAARAYEARKQAEYALVEAGRTEKAMRARKRQQEQQQQDAWHRKIDNNCGALWGF